MPSSKLEVKTETRLDKVSKVAGRSKSTELSARGGASDMRNASLVPLPSGSQDRSDTYTPSGGLQQQFVPVIDGRTTAACDVLLDVLKEWVESNQEDLNL